MIKVIFLSLLLLAPVTTLAQKLPEAQLTSPPRGNGFYSLTIKDESDKTVSEIIVYLRRREKRLEMFDLTTGKKYESELSEVKAAGIVPNASVEYGAFAYKRKNDGPSQLVVAMAEGAQGEGVFAMGMHKEKQFSIVIEALASVWACGNHSNPTHTAKSETDMRALAAANGCTLWHKLAAAEMKE